VLKINIDDIDAEPLQTRLAGDRHVFRAAIGAAALTVGPAHIAELGSNQDLVALALDRLGDQFLVLTGRISVRRVEQVDAEFDGAMHGCDRFHVIRHAVIAAHA
jgi:hypothetical protein